MAVFSALLRVSFAFAALLSLTTAADVHQQRREEFARIKHYELVSLNVAKDASFGHYVIDFDAFGQHFKLALHTKNHGVNPANLKHTNRQRKDEDSHDEYFTSLTSPCHYFGDVISPAQSSVLALSACPKRGIRGEFVLDSETYFIKPAKYYLDPEFDATHAHEFEHTHLIYRWSDFNTTGIPLLRAIEVDPMGLFADSSKSSYSSSSSNSHSHSSSSVSESQSQSQSGEDDGLRRRRLANSINQVEMFILVDPSFIQHFKDTYSGTWYQSMVSYLSDILNSVSTYYRNTQWYGGIATITIHFVEIELATAYTGRYSSLYPTYTGAKIDGSGYLGKFANWIGNYKTTSTFDNAQLWTKTKFLRAAGWGNLNVVCKGSSSVANICDLFGDFSTKASTHELGHNFGMSHDGSGKAASCASSPGIMGTSGQGSTFSSCSKSMLQTYFSNNGGLTCLATGVAVSTPRTNYGGGGGGGGSSSATTTTTTQSSGGSCTRAYTCVGLWSLDSINSVSYNGYYYYNGCLNGHAYYKKSGQSKYIYHSNSDYWSVSTSLTSGAGYCWSTNLMQCSSNWMYYTSKWVTDSNAYLWDCGSSSSGLNGGSSGSSGSSSSCSDHSYGSQLCLFNADKSEWSSNEANYTDWLLDKGLCSEDKPVFYYRYINSSLSLQDLLSSVPYYLHFKWVQKHSDQNATVARWIISKKAIEENGYAYCEQENLFACVEGSWVIQQLTSLNSIVFGGNESGSWNSTDHDSSITTVVNLLMKMHPTTCNVVLYGSSNASDDDESDDDSKNAAIIAVVVVCVVILIILAVVGGVYFCKKKKATATQGQQYIAMSS